VERDVSGARANIRVVCLAVGLSISGISPTILAIRCFSLEFRGGKWFLGQNECPA
jgi:hypothetical protein